jgi:hypothetical protein
MDNSLTTSFSSSASQTRSMVAQILAREAITVTHDPSMPSAAFDLKNRTLILPCWDTSKVGDNAKPVYDFLVGHEVGHAKHTPADGWKTTSERIGGTDPRSQKVAADFLNVVEDARIEKMIKREFPGLRKDFTVGYQALAKMDIFGIGNRDIGTMRFIDRINLHFKLGIHNGLEVPFHNDVEREFVKRIDSALSFDDVAQIAADLYAHEQEKKRDAEREDGEGNAGGVDGKDDGSEGKTGTDGKDQGKADGKDQGKGEGNDGTDGDDGSEGSEGSEGDADGNGEDAEGNNPSKQSGDNDAEEGKDSTKSRNGNGKAPDPSARGGCVNNPTPEGSETQDALENFKQVMSDAKGAREIVLRVADIDASKVVIQPLDFVNLVNENLTFDDGNSFGNAKCLPDPIRVQKLALACYDASSRRQKASVDAMVKRFETRRAARDHSLMGSCKSGRISMRSLTKYKFSEDIFDRITIKRDEKNHGIVILLDWSGSMGQILQSATEQVCGIVQFCRRVGIPAEVYVFTTMHVPVADKWLHDDIMSGKVGSRDKDGKPIETRHTIARWGSCAKYSASGEAFRFTDHVCNLPEGTTAKGNHAIYQPFSLFKVHDAKMDIRKFQNTFGRLLLLTQLCGNMKDPEIFREGIRTNYPRIGDALMLGNTPLDESIVAMRSIVENFRKSSNTKVTFISMSDGDGSSLVSHHHHTAVVAQTSDPHRLRRVLVDGRTGRRYADSEGGFSSCGSTQLPVVQMFRDTTDAAIVGIMMTSHRGSREEGNNATTCGTYIRWYWQKMHDLRGVPNGTARDTRAADEELRKITENSKKQFVDNSWLALDLPPYNMYFIVGIRSDNEVANDQKKELRRLGTMKNRKVALTRQFILNAEAAQINRAFINRLMDIVA